MGVKGQQQARRIHGPLLTGKQEDFAVGVAMGKSNVAAATDAGYPAHSARSKGAQLMAIPKIKERVNQLVALSTGEKVLSIIGRKQRLSEFALENNLTEKGSLIRGGSIEAIKELNKMDNVYVRQPHADSTRPINILVTSSEAADILRRMLAGERREGEIIDVEKVGDY